MDENSRPRKQARLDTIREDNFRFWWRRVHEDASQGMYMSKIEIFFFIEPISSSRKTRKLTVCRFI
jgi:hypothetical protein